MRRYIGIGVAALTININTYLTIPDFVDKNSLLERRNPVEIPQTLGFPMPDNNSIYGYPFPKPSPPTAIPKTENVPQSIRKTPPTTTADEIRRYLYTTVNSSWIPWFEAVITCESRWNPHAKNSSGASGLMQFMPATFKGNGGINIWDWKDQIDTANRMITKNPGSKYLWTCSKLMGF